MILSNNFPITFRQVNQLPKLNYHIKEEARVKMLVQAIELKLLNPDTGTIDFYSKDTNYDGKKWNFDFVVSLVFWLFTCILVIYMTVSTL